jgi:hypothetical protein
MLPAVREEKVSDSFAHRGQNSANSKQDDRPGCR